VLFGKSGVSHTAEGCERESGHGQNLNQAAKLQVHLDKV
jgi:hypothetical protein